MPSVSCCIVDGSAPNHVGDEAGGPRDGPPWDAPGSAASEVGGQGFLARRVEKRSVEVEIRCNLVPHASARLPTLHERTAYDEAGGVISGLVARRAVDASTSTVVLPPRQRMAEVAGDEEPDFAGCKAVISHFFIVVEVRDDGLC